AAQPLQPGAAQKTMQHGLRLIVGGVSGGHPVCAFSAGNFRQPIVASLAGGAFKVFSSSPCQLRDIDSLATKRQHKICSQASNKILIGVAGCATKLVIEMGNG